MIPDAAFYILCGFVMGIALMKIETCIPGRSFVKWLYHRFTSPCLQYCCFCKDYWNLFDFCIGTVTICPYDRTPTPPEAHR